MGYNDPIANAELYIYAAYGLTTAILVMVTLCLYLENRKLSQLVTATQTQET